MNELIIDASRQPLVVLVFRGHDEELLRTSLRTQMSAKGWSAMRTYDSRAIARSLTSKRFWALMATRERPVQPPNRWRCCSTGSAARTASPTGSPQPRSPTTTGKVARFHRALRTELRTDRTFPDLETAQAELDTWVAEYNHRRPHQALAGATPADRFLHTAPAPVSGRPPRPPGPPPHPIPAAETATGSYDAPAGPESSA
ncbi:integrase core domain-containing protein [Kribbella qitaiheensis]|uniref:integrase core domain-containing protein n=1 Tax=Kribbella qitaiheensis TaxID=1544730 RepID=UPI00361EA36D